VNKSQNANLVFVSSFKRLSSDIIIEFVQLLAWYSHPYQSKPITLDVASSDGTPLLDARCPEAQRSCGCMYEHLRSVLAVL